MTDLYSSKPIVREYNGGRAEVTDIARSRNAVEKCGERVIIMRWLDDTPEHPAGTVTAKHIKGNAWRAPSKFMRYDERVITGDPMDYARERLCPA